MREETQKRITPVESAEYQLAMAVEWFSAKTCKCPVIGVDTVDDALPFDSLHDWTHEEDGRLYDSGAKTFNELLQRFCLGQLEGSSEAAGVIDPRWIGDERFEGNLSVHVAVVSSRVFFTSMFWCGSTLRLQQPGACGRCWACRCMPRILLPKAQNFVAIWTSVSATLWSL